MSNPIIDIVEIPIVPYVDIEHATTAYGRVWYKKYKRPVLVIGCAILVIHVLSFFAFPMSEALIWFMVFSLLGYGGGIYAIVYSGGKLYFYKSIAQDWGWKYSPEMVVTTLRTSLLKVGHTHSLTDVLEGTWQNHQALLGSFSYTVGHGKSSRTYSCALAKVDTTIILPHILFAVTSDVYDNHILRETNLVSVPLEQLAVGRRGLYVQQKLEIEALQLFTPALIGEIELKWPTYSFELLGHEIYVYGYSALGSRVQVQDLFALIQYIIQHMMPKLQHMEGSVKAMHEVLSPK